MSDLGGGRSAAYDGIVLVLLGVLVVAWGFAALFPSLIPSGLLRARGPLAIASTLGVAIAWNLGLPPSNGIEGAGRFLFGGAGSAILFVLSAVLWTRAAATEGTPTPWAALGVHAAAIVGYWTYFVLH